MDSTEDHEIHSDLSDESDDGDQQYEGRQGGSSQSNKKTRSSRACLACRRMKTRCEVDETLGTACKLCIRARRQCIMQTLPRRRKKKTTDRVADLERKINVLTALLANSDSTLSRTTNASSTVEASSSRGKVSDPVNTQTPEAPPTLIAEAVERGLLTWEGAYRMFDKYREEMCHYFPFVVFPTTSTAELVKEQQPLLFFTIVTVATGTLPGCANLDLWDMLTKVLALRIMYHGERSLELVQTLIVYVTWYNRGKEMQELNFNQMVHIACTMALDIGLGRRSLQARSARQADPHQLESLTGRRAWLGCYYMGASLSMSLRHPAFVRWSVYVEECLDVLSSEPLALPTDKWLCDLIRIQHVAEDASVVFSMDDPGAIVTFRDVKTQYQIGGFRQRLEHWRRYSSTDLEQSYVRHIEASATLFIHEIAVHSEHNVDELRSPIRPGTIGTPPDGYNSAIVDLHFVPARIESLFACLTAIHASFDAILSMSLPTLCILPNLFYVRTGYAARTLRKLLNICESQAEVAGQSNISIADLRFEEYMDLLIHLFAKVHAENSSHIVRAFCMVLTQIKAQGLKLSKPGTFFDCTKDTTSKIDPGSTASSSSTPLLTRQSDAPPNELSMSDMQHPGFISDLPLFQPSGQPSNPSPGQQLVGIPVEMAFQPDLPVWLQNEPNDFAMTGNDFFQWFQQDFTFDDLEQFDRDDLTFPANGGGYQS